MMYKLLVRSIKSTRILTCANKLPEASTSFGMGLLLPFHGLQHGFDTQVAGVNYCCYYKDVFDDPTVYGYEWCNPDTLRSSVDTQLMQRYNNIDNYILVGTPNGNESSIAYTLKYYGHPVASALFARFNSKLYNVLVPPEFRGFGHGKQLISRIQKRESKIRLDAVPYADNPMTTAQLIKFYQNLGFTIDLDNRLSWGFNNA